MRIYHLNCGTMHGFDFPREDGTGGFFKRGLGVIHCLLVETGEGLVLVDTGWGKQDCADPSPTVKFFMGVTGCSADPGETAVERIVSLGFSPSDVKHIFLTHLHLDHASGLPDIPDAVVHVQDVELAAFLHPRSLMERFAYRPEHRQHQPRWQVHHLQNDRWFGLACLPPVQIGEAAFVMVPFTGHTRGHCAVAIRQGEQWMLHCGDAYGYYRQVDPDQPYRHPDGKLMEAVVTWGFRMPRRNWITIRGLVRAYGDRVQTCCSHDLHEYRSMSAG